MIKRSTLFIFLLALGLALAGCASDTEQAAVGPSAKPTGVPVAKVAPQDINSLTLVDKASLYDEYDPTELVYFYITVKGGNAADGTDHTFEEVNAYRNLQGMYDVEKIKSEVLFQIGDASGPLPGELGYSNLSANATINVRGRTSTGYPQKSYRISLFDNAGLWRGQKAIAINKHPSDLSRLRNMLYFELLQGVPGLTSLRTQFVHVYIKDETDPEAPDAFVDYGLYTQIELPNGRFLRNHDLSRDGGLYKANMSEMFRYEDNLKLATDPEYDLAMFSRVYEPKTTENHTNLLTMLEAVNNYERPIQEVIEQHFNLENLTSYLAFNMLLANPDSNAQNHLLYNPVNSDTWYFICWDGDAMLEYYQDELLGNTFTEGLWTRGISDYWAVVLFNRMLRVETYRDAVLAKVEQLRQTLTPERIAGLIAKYREVVDPFTSRMPDAINMRISTENLELVYQNMPYDTDKAYAYILESFEKPMPFYLGEVQATAAGLRLDWDSSYDFGGDFLRYDVQVATDWSFSQESIVFEALDQLELSATAPRLSPGQYYWRAVVRNEDGHTQVAFDQVTTDTGSHSGMRRFTVREDGSVVNE
jgi:spore coat protein H